MMKILNLDTPPRQTLAFHIIPGGGERLFHSEASDTPESASLSLYIIQIYCSIKISTGQNQEHKNETQQNNDPHQKQTLTSK